MKVQGILMDWQNRRDKLFGKVHFVQQLDSSYAIQHFFVEVISPPSVRNRWQTPDGASN